MKRVLLSVFSYISIVSLIGQNNLISNTSDCAGTRPPFEFNIQRAWSSNTGQKVDSRHTPIAGDIDGDGNVEVFASNGLPGGGGILYVFEGRTGTLAGQINCPGIATTYSNGFIVFKRNATAKGTVFIAGRNGILYLYEVRNATRPLQFDLVWTKSLHVGATLPVAADLNGDGNVEIIAGRYILDANTGNILSTLHTTGTPHNSTLSQIFPLVADVDKDGYPEVILGSEIYKFNTGFTANPTSWRRCPGFTSTQTGTNMVGDINQDGNVDVVFAYASESTCNVTVWTPATNTTVGNFSFTIGNSFSYPFVGDIDGVIINGKKYPEICINTASHLYAYTFNGTSFVLKWDMSHSDMSGATSLTLFDFNLDGIVELVYRDETHLHIFNGSRHGIVDATAPIPCGSATIVEAPIIADVTGDGSADIIVTGYPTGKVSSSSGEVNVFEGAASKWASCPPVWNQQLYSNLLVNRDLTIPTTINPVNLTYQLQNGNPVQYYNGGPIQAPYISDETYLPFDLAPDIYIAGGTIQITSPTSVKLTVTFGNQGLASASASLPIRYYKTLMTSGNILDSTVLGINLAPGQTTTITKELSGLNLPMPSRFYVRILDDGTNFPAHGAYSDCNLTNNHKSFGTLELLKTVNAVNACVDGTSIFTVKLINNTGQILSRQTFEEVILIDSLGTGWEYLSSHASSGTLTAYNPVNRQIKWLLGSISSSDTAELIITVKAINAGAIRNTVWIESINNTIVGREVIEAYVIVNSSQAPDAAVILPNSSGICTGDSVLLTSSIRGKSSYQWYRNNIEIPNGAKETHWTKTPGNYTLTYFDGTCVSQMSAPATVIAKNSATTAVIDIDGTANVCYGMNTTLTASMSDAGNAVFHWYASQTATKPFHTGATYTTSALVADTAFYVGIEGGNYCQNETGYRKVVNISVYPELLPGIIGVSQTFCSGTMPAISLGTTQPIGGSGNYSYQWQSRTDSNTWNNIGVTTYDYALNELSQTTRYRRMVTDVCGTKYSNTIQITIFSPPVVSAKKTAICVGTTTGLSPTKDGIWSSDDTGVVIIENNNTAIGVSPGTAILSFTSSITGCVEIVIITVGKFPAVNEITGEHTVYIGESVELTNTTIGGTWKSNNDNVTVSNPTDNPVIITGVSKGGTYISYTVGTGVCQTRLILFLSCYEK